MASDSGVLFVPGAHCNTGVGGWRKRKEQGVVCITVVVRESINFEIW